MKIFITKRACPLDKLLLKFTSQVQFCRPSNPLFAKLLYLFGYKLSGFYTNLFIYNNFICNNQYKKAAIREELNPHVR